MNNALKTKTEYEDCPQCDPCNPAMDEDGRPYSCYCCGDTGRVPVGSNEPDPYLWYTVRDGGNGKVDVHGFKEQVGGVLDGQTIKHFINTFETEAEAFAAYPDAKYGSKWTDPQVSLSHLSDREGYSDDYDDGDN